MGGWRHDCRPHFTDCHQDAEHCELPLISFHVYLRLQNFKMTPTHAVHHKHWRGLMKLTFVEGQALKVILPTDLCGDNDAPHLHQYAQRRAQEGTRSGTLPFWPIFLRTALHIALAGLQEIKKNRGSVSSKCNNMLLRAFSDLLTESSPTSKNQCIAGQSSWHSKYPCPQRRPSQGRGKFHSCCWWILLCT